MEKLNPQKTYANQKTQVISLEKGKIPPQAIDLEEVVLGAMMVDKRGVDEVIDILHPEVFYNNPTNKYLKLSLCYLKKDFLLTY